MWPTGHGKAALRILTMNGASHLPWCRTVLRTCWALGTRVSSGSRDRSGDILMHRSMIVVGHALPARRIALLASVAALGVGVVVGGPILHAGFGLLNAPAQAQNLQRPVGFADIVEK